MYAKKKQLQKFYVHICSFKLHLLHFVDLLDS